MKNKSFIVLCLITAISSCSLLAQEEVDFFANNAYGNPIIGQTAEYHNGITYIAYQGDLEDPYVVSYDHANKSWAGPYKAGTSLLGKDGDIDNHGKPTLVVDGEGYIHLVYGGHGGTRDLGDNTLGNYHDGKQIHVKTKNPLDISSWEEVNNITPFGTYSQFIKMDNGDIYLIYRHGAHRSNWVYQVSTDNCLTFSPKVSFLKAKQIGVGPDGKTDWDSWYISLKKSKANEILVSSNYHFCKGGTRHTGERQHCYFMSFNTDTKAWYNAKGETLQIPVDKEYADTMTLAVNTGDRWNHIGPTSLNHDNHPHISWYEGEDDGSNHGGPKQMVSYQWTGNEWTGGNTNLPVGARGEMLVTSPNAVKVLLGSKENGGGQVAWWESSDGGRNFVKKEVLIDNPGANFQLSHLIRYAHSDAYIIATQKVIGTDYSRIHLLGDDGSIKRSLSDADVLNNLVCPDFEWEGQYTLFNPNKSKWVGYDAATNDALVTDQGDAEMNKFNIVANGDKFNIYTGDNQKVLIINSAMGFTAMLATPTTEVLASGDALFTFEEVSGACLFIIKSGAIDSGSGSNFNLNVKSNSSDVGRGTSEIPNYQWEVTRLGDSSLSISDQLKNNEQFLIYPNPAKNQIHFSGRNVKHASIYNSLGKLIEVSSIENNQMDVSMLGGGLYIMKIVEANGAIMTSKFLVE